MSEIGIDVNKDNVILWDINFEDEHENMDITPKEKGVSIELFAAMGVYFKEFLKKKKPEIIHFSTFGDKSRLKLYDTLARRMAKAGYIYNPSKDEPDYILIRKDLVV